jgi:hypothetical protein
MSSRTGWCYAFLHNEQRQTDQISSGITTGRNRHPLLRRTSRSSASSPTTADLPLLAELSHADRLIAPTE